jgi:hypothetical protein
VSPAVEDESRPCPYNREEGPCPGRQEPEIEDSLVTWTCNYCQGTSYGKRVSQQDACQAGVPAALQQPAPPSSTTFLGPTIGRRPS